MSASTPAAAVHRVQETAWGTHWLPDGRVRFRLWAPACRQLQLLVHDTAHAMQRGDDDWFETVLSVPAGTPYRYRLDDGTVVPDPAARAQAGDVEDASVVVDPASWCWQDQAWSGRPWHEAVICELHVGLLGGFDGVRQQLPRLAAAGYTAIELMPIGAFPGARNWGYDGVLPYAPATAYGSVDALKQLVEEAHACGLMVLLDVVYNHFGPSGNYLPRYAPTFFRDDVPTPWGAAIDFRREPVQQFVIDNALMWINEYHMDGLRLDAVHAIAPPQFLRHLEQAIRAGSRISHPVHLVLENEHNSASLLRDGAYQAQWNDDGHNALHALLTGESEGYYGAFADDPTAHLARVLAEGFAFQGEPDLRGRPRGEPSGDLPPTRFVLFAQNHDQIGNRPLGQRLATLIEPPAMRATTALVALCPMVPLFFMGDEWGCRSPFLFFTSHPPALAEAVREGRRAEFASFAGFHDPVQREAIPDPNDAATFDASIPAIESAAPAAAWARWFTGLLSVRMHALVPQLPGASSRGVRVLAPGAMLASWRLADGSDWTLAINLSGYLVDVPALDGQVICAEPPEVATAPSSGRLLPWSLLALRSDEPHAGGPA
ncbi:malto-oligosyltrehalose trehalohydrolase [Dyella sp.]|jgi:maltooligosyltrehalose trehalohydrolase|uniref:malto-oligosyltrehalose trehalohydrolase n=1 Tax=Dyella sp. TaxID=1869338 RepID=UPI002D77C6AC|nr:malto-oligosyltrehalose trehalohydrolase [Dyella sp.]HET6433110.1 malto-oligosyltrehalose trehalohydrolase [Dyella sp.]